MDLLASPQILNGRSFNYPICINIKSSEQIKRLSISYHYPNRCMCTRNFVIRHSPICHYMSLINIQYTPSAIALVRARARGRGKASPRRREGAARPPEPAESLGNTLDLDSKSGSRGGCCRRRRERVTPLQPATTLRPPTVRWKRGRRGRSRRQRRRAARGALAGRAARADTSAPPPPSPHKYGNSFMAAGMPIVSRKRQFAFKS